MNTVPSEEEMMNAPWDYAGFVVVPGRHFDRMYFLYLPPEIVGPWGGDFNGLIWRFGNNPNEWYFTYRTRYYAGENTDPHGGEDRKEWSSLKSRDLLKLREAVATIAREAGRHFKTTKPDEHVIVIEGDSDKFFKIIKEGNFPFMHVKTIAMPT